MTPNPTPARAGHRSSATHPPPLAANPTSAWPARPPARVAAGMADESAGSPPPAADGARPAEPEMRPADPPVDGAPADEGPPPRPGQREADADADADAPAEVPADDPDPDSAASAPEDDDAPRRWKGKGKEREVILPRGPDPEPIPDPPPATTMFSFPAPQDADAAPAPPRPDTADRHAPEGEDIDLETEYGAFPKSEADWVLSTKPNGAHVTWEKSVDKGKQPDRAPRTRIARPPLRQRRSDPSGSKDLPEAWVRTADRAPQKLPVRFIDAVGRNFIWPWDRAKSWKVSLPPRPRPQDVPLTAPRRA